MKLVLLPQARADLDSITDPLLGRILKRLAALRDYPSLGTPLHEPFDEHRSTVVGSYRIVYRVGADFVAVCYVRDCRRV